MVTHAGAVVGRGASDVRLIVPAPGHAEQEPSAWWRAVRRAVNEAITSVDVHRIGAAALSGQMHGLVLLDDRLRVLTRAIVWPDQRSGHEVAALTAEIGERRILNVCGGPLATGFMAPSLRWVREQRRDLWSRVRHVASPKDYVRLRLTGHLASEPSDAAGTGLFDIRKRAWDTTMLTAAGLEHDHLPPVQASIAPAGTLLPRPATELGLPAGLPIVTGAADTACGLLGAGALEPDTVLVTLSSGGQIVLPSARPSVDPAGRSHTFCGALEPSAGASAWYRMGALLSAGLSLRWLRDSVFRLPRRDAFERMIAWAAETPPGARGLLFLPYLLGERTPHMDPDARGVLFGLTVRHQRGEIVRAVLEGVSFACLDAVRALEAGGGHPSRVVLAGGGAQSPLWRVIIADILGLPVHPLATREQAAVGAALLAGGGIGLLDSSEAARRWARTETPVAPDPSRHALYQDLGATYRDLYGRLRDEFRRLGEIEGAADNLEPLNPRSPRRRPEPAGATRSVGCPR